MGYQRVNISNKLFLCSIIFFLLLMSASVTHAEDYQAVNTWGFPGSELTQFNSPQGVAVDSSGNVYVADTENHRIQKFDSDGGYLSSWGSEGSGDGEFSNPQGIAVDSSDNVYIADTSNNRIQKFDSNGNFLIQWGSSGTGNGEFSNPQGIAVDPFLGDIYVADTGNDRIQRFDSSGNFISTWGSSGTGNGEFLNPQGIAIDSIGTAYVADTGNNRIQMFGSNGIFLYTWGSSGTGWGEFSVPTGIAFDSLNNVYIVDTSNNRVQKFDNSGMFITTWGYYGTGYGEFSNPQGIAVDSSGSVYVADSDNDCIQKFAKIDPVFPVANFSSNVTSGHAPLSVQFTDSSENATGWTWDFGDGNTSTNKNPAHIFSAPGNYNVSLTASNLNGTNSTFANITVSEPPVLPVANFNNNVTSGYAPLSVQFTDSSENSTGWTWDFGDGNTSTEQNPTHIYSAVGDYAVNLTVSNENGTNSEFTDITVLEQPVAYQSYAYISNSASNTVSVIDTTDNTVKATVNVGNGPWGVAATLDGKVYVVNDQGHTVSVIDIATNTVTATIPVGNNPFGIAANLNGTKVYVTNQGSYNVSVIDTATDTVTASVDVESIPAGIAVNPAGTKVYVTQENGNISVIDTANSTVVANVSVGNIPTGITVSPTGKRVYVTNQGSNNVSVIDTSTDTVIATVNIGLGPAGVILNPTGTKVYAANMGTNSVSVIDTATNTVSGAVDVGSSPFGVSVTLDGTKVYVANMGSSAVSVIDTATNTVTASVDVGNSPIAFGQFIGPKLVLPVANFSSNVTEGYAPLSVQFTDNSENATGWTWDFGDENTSIEQNPTHIYSSVGNYTVNLTASNENGTNSSFADITVLEYDPAYTIDKTVTDVAGKGSSVNVTASGDVISYQIDVNNTGNINLTSIDVTDPLLGSLTGPSGDDFSPEVLNVGENWTYTGTYTVTQADITSNGNGDGFINNTATVDCDELDLQSNSAEVAIEQNPGYTIDKIVIDVAGNGSSANVTKSGDVISYQINVTNDGNVDLTNVNVDDLLITLEAPIESLTTDEILGVGEIWTYLGNYTVTQADLNNNGDGNGSINNTATVDCDELDSQNDSVGVPIEQNPSYTIDKTVFDVGDRGAEANATTEGDLISYQVEINNTGNIDLTNVIVNDPLFMFEPPQESLTTDGILEVGETWTCIGNYAITQDDLNNNGDGDGFINNTATVDCDELDPQNDSVGVPIEQSPAYTIEKTATDVAGNGSLANITKAGDVISYQVNVINDGNIDLMNVSADDPLIILEAPVESLTEDGILGVGENWTYLGNYTVTQTDLNNNGDGDGFINNTATVDCDELDSQNDSAEVPIEQNLVYSVNKTVTDVAGKGSEANVSSAGDVISYQINVINDGNVDFSLYNINNASINDSLFNLTSLPIESKNNDQILEVGEIWTFNGNYTVTQEDLNNNGGGDGFINNTVTVYTDEFGLKNDSANVPVIQNPAYTIEKSVVDVSGNGSSANVTKAGDLISYQISVNNTGNIDLTNVSVDDPLINLTEPTESLTSDDILGVGEIWTYYGNYTVNQADLNDNGDGDGFINNTATVDCVELNLQNDSAEVPIEYISGCDIDKMVIDVAGQGPEGNISSAGDVVQFQLNVTNTGNTDLTNISVHDSLINFTGPYEERNLFGLSQSMQKFQALQPADSILGVGETWIYLGNYTVTQEDLNNNGDGDGFLNSTVTFDSDQTEPINDSTIIYGNESDNETGNETGNESRGIHIYRNPAYSFYKSVIEVDNGGDCIVDDAGDIIRYRIVIKNEGNIDLTNVSVNDTLTTLNGPTGDDVNPGILNPGEIWKFYGNYTVIQADLNNNGGGDGDIDNTATVSCSELPNRTASISQPISQDAYLRIYKSAIGVDNTGDNIANEAGDIIEYQIAVKNDGKVDLTGVSVDDPMISLVGPVEYKSTDGVLEVGELWTYTGNYTLTQEDLNISGDGYIDNTATVSCNEFPNATSSIEVPLITAKTVAEGTDSESNNTTDNNTEDNTEDNNSDDNSNSGSSGSGHKSGGGIGSARVVSNTSKVDEGNETSKENGTEIKPESDTKDVEETTQNEVTNEPQTENKENTDINKETSKKSPGFEMIYGIEACLLYLFVKGNKKNK